jgi:hypothetical protein
MNQDQFDGTPGDDNQEEQAPAPAPGDDDINISNTGQRVRAILVLLVVLAAGGGFFYWYSNHQKEIAVYEDARTAFQEAHNLVYVAFWKKTQVDIKKMKSNEDFELRMKQFISSDDPMGYSEHLKTEALKVIKDGLPKYKNITVPTGYSDKMDAITKSIVELRDAWSSFADELAKLGPYFKNKKKLNNVANSWLGSQQSKDEKHLEDSIRYFKLLQCILPGKKIDEIETADINWTIKDSCSKAAEKANWYRRVAYDCFPKIGDDPGEPSESYTATIAKAREAETMDHASKFGIEDCLKSSRDFIDTEMTEKIAVAWANYVKAQNDFLDSIDSKLEEIR